MNTSVVLSSNFHHGETNAYLRTHGSETIAALETALGALDGGTATVLPSGMSAISTFVETLPVGTVLVIPSTSYWGTMALLSEQARLGRVQLRPVDITDTDAVLAALHPSDGPTADVLWLETTINPTLGVPDLPVLIDAAHADGAVVGVDATFSTPLNVRPLELGADLVMHSVTKYLSGHSDLVQGVLVTRSAELHEHIRARRLVGGAVPGALECYLSLRGLRTLDVRFARQQENAAELARRLDAHPAVSRVRYPGLPSDPFHTRASELFDGYGAMVSFELAGSVEDADAVCERVRLIAHATSLGGVESLIERRAMYEGDASMGVPATLLRLSVGIEHVDDLWADLSQALG